MNKNLIRCIVVILGSGLSAVAGADPRTVNDAIYSEDQADSGEQLYKDHCLTCHDKKYFRPVLKRWDGQQLERFSRS